MWYNFWYFSLSQNLLWISNLEDSLWTFLSMAAVPISIYRKFSRVAFILLWLCHSISIWASSWNRKCIAVIKEISSLNTSKNENRNHKSICESSFGISWVFKLSSEKIRLWLRMFWISLDDWKSLSTNANLNCQWQFVQLFFTITIGIHSVII